MKKLWKTILILLLIVFLFLLWLFIIRAKQSKELKSWLLREDSNWIIQQVVWGWNDLSINVNWPQTVLRIPISSVVPERLTRESFKFELNLYDENWNKLDYIIDGIERWEGGWVTSWIVIPFFKDSILWMKEFKMPVWAISRINEDTFQVELEDFDWYADIAWDDIWYKILGKWKIDSVYLEIFHWNNVKLEFAIIDDEVIIEDYCEWAECKDSYPWEIEDLYWTYKLVWFNYEITDIPATLTISEKLIWAKFCNGMWSDNYSIGDNYIHVNNMSQTEMLCDSEKLMEYESKFDLSNAKISLVEKNLRLTTPNWDIYDFFKNNEESIIEPEILDEEWTTDIPLDWLVYRNDEYWFQIKFWKERSGGKIYDSFRKYNIYNYNTDYNGWIKNPFIVFTVPSPRRTWKFENIADIIVYTYEEYEQARQNQMDPECLMCSLEEFDKAIVWKNNKYYFLLGRSNRSDDELKTIFPSLECREETDSSVYWTYTYIYCDWIEYINWEPKKTWKNWIEQILPAESFSFFDV